MWRFTDQKDALSKDCIGPSRYSKGQGLPIRVWGLLIRGRLHITVLEEGVRLNQWIYAELIRGWFRETIGRLRGPLLIQDYEKCIRAPESLRALKEQKIRLLPLYPKYSQDLNAIENAWARLRHRLDDTYPAGEESRAEFIRRLRAAVGWINKNKSEDLAYLHFNLKERADDVLEQDGGRTKW